MVELDAPGAGLPGFEKFYLGLFLRLGSAVYSDKVTLANFQRTSQAIFNVVEDHDIDILSRVLLIPRLQGIEDSSRNWSVLMVLEHLAMVNREITQTIRSLKSGNQTMAKVDIADFKPSDDVGVEAIDNFRDSNQRYWSFVKSHSPLRTQLTATHPWFGELDGHTWHVLATAHQKVHLRQIYKILAMIGIT